MTEHNAADLELATEWLQGVVASCLNIHFRDGEAIEVDGFRLKNRQSSLAKFLAAHRPSQEEFLILMLALAPHLKPELLSKTIAAYLPEGGEFPEFGGVKAGNHRGIIPTGETAQFIVAGPNLDKRLEVQQMLSSGHWFARKRILWLDRVPEGEPPMSGRLVLEPELVEFLTLGNVSRPRFSTDFPAEHIETEMEWDDLVLHPETLLQIREIEDWITHSDTLLREWGMRKKIKPGYRALFYGPPGTGKTLTATLLGKYTGKDVFRIDLSRVVSKYIGETEKNLSRLFDKAENKDWILFFDEADALFGKRTDIRDAHDKYANQEIAYLLQRIEGHGGVVILATNQRGNVDSAFARRFQSIIHFPMPRPQERCQLWEKAFPPQIEIAGDIDWHDIAARFEISGAGIINVAQYCAVQLLADGDLLLDFNRLQSAILREYVKEGKLV